MPCRPAIDGARPPRGMLRHMRCHPGSA
jgi:hypothetical protein